MKPFYLITGFLGSGKTTLLKRLLDAYADTRRIAVVQNEFAETGVDGAELRRSGKPFQLLEVNRGSVFCVCLLSDFVGSMAAFLDEHRPDAVVLEATGLADPIALAQMVAAPALASRILLRHVWCVADASTFVRLEATVARVNHQVRVADTVLLNKADLADEAALSAAETRLRAINPFAVIRRTRFCDTDLSAAFTEILEPPVAIAHADSAARFTPCGRPDMGTAVLRSARGGRREALDGFLRALGDAAHRVKGYVRLGNGGALAVQKSFADIRIHRIDEYQGTSELVVIGPGITPERVRVAFDLAFSAPAPQPASLP